MAEKEKQAHAAQGPSDERGRDRSPPFPFISLEKAIERANQFEAQYKKASGRIVNALAVWDYTPKSSGGQQTVGALKAFGLVEDEGSGDDRKIKLTDLALRILKDERPGKRDEGIKEAALKPKAIAEHWNLWGPERPPDAECRSELTLERGYTEDAANRFLRVYDETVEFAKLQKSDSVSEKKEALIRAANHGFAAFFRGGDVHPPKASPPKAEALMEERVVFAQEIEAPQQTLRVLVAGPVDEAVLEALEDFVEFQRSRLAKRTKADVPVVEAAPSEPRKVHG